MTATESAAGRCGMNPYRGRTSLYRVWGENDLLLYVGVSKSFGTRWHNHGSTQPWWGEMRRLTVDRWYETRDEAEAAEAAAIWAEKPKYNKDHTAKPPPATPARRRLTGVTYPWETPYVGRLPVLLPAKPQEPIKLPPRQTGPSSTSVPCRQCGARPGELCVTITGNVVTTYVHIERIHDLPREGRPGRKTA